MSIWKGIYGNDNNDGVIFDTGNIDGFVVEYSTSTQVLITSGSCEANGKFYTLDSSITHNLTSLASAFDFHYIYIDDDASTEPNPVIIDSTTEPSWSDSKRGWYNGNDRCIGVVSSTNGASTIYYFSNEIVSQKNIRAMHGRTESMASSMNPSGSWQTPTSSDGSSVTPVNAISIQIILSNTDAGASVLIAATSKEHGDIRTNINSGSFYAFEFDVVTATTPFFGLGSTRNIYIAGDNGDDNNLTCFLNGFGYSR